ncbi:MAG: SPFH domain-containing protein, partial [Bacteroidales bacterium]|nr:SPFH domain-containing protein [Bacteroidales bacterium]
MDTNEFSFKGFKANGFLMLFANFLLILVCVALLVFFSQLSVWVIVIAVLGLIKSFFIWAGFFELEPNEARLMVFFGKYKGTFRETGFYWVNPFITKKKLSMRSRNLDVKPIKVNDKAGNPIMIGLVLIWKLSDTYKAMFDIDSQTMASTNPASGTSAVGIQTVSSRMNAFENFVKVQSDAALRQVAGQYAYDDNESEGDSITLRGGGEEINHRLVAELNNRLSMAGIEISEARL